MTRTLADMIPSLFKKFIGSATTSPAAFIRTNFSVFATHTGHAQRWDVAVVWDPGSEVNNTLALRRRAETFLLWHDRQKYGDLTSRRRGFYARVVCRPKIETGWNCCKAHWTC